MSSRPGRSVAWMRAGALTGFGELAAQLGQAPQPMLRRFGLRSTEHIAEEILNDLPDPDRSIDVRPR